MNMKISTEMVKARVAWLLVVGVVSLLLSGGAGV